jgi:hypothetical protein
MERGYWKAIAGMIIVVAIFVFYSHCAFAYPVSGTQDQTTGATLQMPSFNFNFDWVNNIWNTLSTNVLQAFTSSIGSLFNGNNSMNTVGKAVSGISIGAGSSQLTIGGVYQNFDNWLYGVAGFHVSEFFNAVVSIIVWLLNLTRNIINWALSLTH